MGRKDNIEDIRKARSDWEQGPLQKAVKRFKLEESPQEFYTPVDVPDFDFMEKVGFPGQYPYTAGGYPFLTPSVDPSRGKFGEGIRRAIWYSGYGTAEDTRDFYREIQRRGWMGGPNMAFSLSTQCGYDSDHPMARGEVGRAGVAIDTLRDLETVYDAFTGPNDLDKIATSWTINPMANVILAMYIAIAKKRGISLDKLKGTPQNDILKEILGRGTTIFPVRPSMRMTRDTLTYCTENMPNFNFVSVAGYHIREAGASAVQTMAFSIANAMEYVRLGINAGLDVDTFMPRFTWISFGGSMEFFVEVCLPRAARRMWAKIMKEKFGAKEPRSLALHGFRGALGSPWITTRQRPLNNLARQVMISCVARCLSGGEARWQFPYDEPIQLGYSLEAMQLATDAARIAKYEAKLEDVADPLAGSYYVEWLTDKLEAEAWDIINKIEAMGGAVAAIERGYQQREIAANAYKIQHEIETGERVVVGVNSFLGEHELEVTTSRAVPHPYDPEKLDEAERRQIDTLNRVRAERDGQQVEAALKRLKDAAQDESANIFPALIEAVEAYASVGEIADTLRSVFGEYQEYTGI